MILADANVLIYAINESSPKHAAARRWLEETLSNIDETFAFAWEVLLAVVRLSTRAQITERPLSVEQAFDLVADWLARPNATVLHPTERHHVVMRELLEPLGTAGNLVVDAHLAALAIEHGATLASSDTDFARFPRLRWVDPLAAAA